MTIFMPRKSSIVIIYEKWTGRVIGCTSNENRKFRLECRLSTITR
jgi:hypothetical protein